MGNALSCDATVPFVGRRLWSTLIPHKSIIRSDSVSSDRYTRDGATESTLSPRAKMPPFFFFACPSTGTLDQYSPLRSLSDLTDDRLLLSRAVSKIAGTDDVEDVSRHQSRSSRGRSSPLQRRRSSDGGSGSVSSFGSAESRQLREGSSGELFPRELTESSSSLDDSGVVSVRGDGSLVGLSGGVGGTASGAGGSVGVRAVLSEYDSGGRGGGGRSSRQSSERSSTGRRGSSIRSLFGSLPNGRKKTPSKSR